MQFLYILQPFSSYQELVSRPCNVLTHFAVFSSESFITDANVAVCFVKSDALSGIVFFPSLRRSSGFQTLGLPSGLLTATFVDRRHRPSRNWVEFLPRRVASLAGLCTAFSKHHSFAS